MAIEEFISGHWYVYKGEIPLRDRKVFMNDRLPHKCNKGDGVFASFFDYEEPEFFLFWNNYNELAMENMFDVTDEIKKDNLQEFLCN